MFPERKGGNSPSQYYSPASLLYASTASCYCSLLLAAYLLYLLKAAIQRFLRLMPLFLPLNTRLMFSVQWTWSCYLQQTKIIINKREWIYLCHLDWYLLKGPFFSKMEIRTRFLNWLLQQLPHIYLKSRY